MTETCPKCGRGAYFESGPFLRWDCQSHNLGGGFHQSKPCKIIAALTAEVARLKAESEAIANSIIMLKEAPAP
jgi:hypothetical protein